MPGTSKVPGTCALVRQIIIDNTFTLIGDSSLHRRAIVLAATHRLPATYDADYLALAERMGIDLYTADAHLVNALQPFKVDWVKLAQG